MSISERIRYKSGSFHVRPELSIYFGSVVDQLRILIVEDEGLIAEMIRVMVEDLNYPEPVVALTKEKAMSILEGGTVDFAILDINLRGGMEGIELAKKANECGVPFMFLTSYSDPKTLKEATQTKPGAYVIKPFSEEELMAGIEMSMMHAKGNTDEFVTVKDGHRSILLRLDEIQLIKAENIYIEIYSVGKKHLTRMSLTSFLEQLPSSQFIRVHRSYAVNTKYIDSLSKSAITVAGQKIPISRSYREEVQLRLKK